MSTSSSWESWCSPQHWEAVRELTAPSLRHSRCSRIKPEFIMRKSMSGAGLDSRKKTAGMTMDSIRSILGQPPRPKSSCRAGNLLQGAITKGLGNAELTTQILLGWSRLGVTKALRYKENGTMVFPESQNIHFRERAAFVGRAFQPVRTSFRVGIGRLESSVTWDRPTRNCSCSTKPRADRVFPLVPQSPR